MDDNFDDEYNVDEGSGAYAEENEFDSNSNQGSNFNSNYNNKNNNNNNQNSYSRNNQNNGFNEDYNNNGYNVNSNTNNGGSQNGGQDYNSQYSYNFGQTFQPEDSGSDDVISDDEDFFQGSGKTAELPEDNFGINMLRPMITEPTPSPFQTTTIKIL